MNRKYVKIIASICAIVTAILVYISLVCFSKTANADELVVSTPTEIVQVEDPELQNLALKDGYEDVVAWSAKLQQVKEKSLIRLQDVRKKYKKHLTTSQKKKLKEYKQKIKDAQSIIKIKKINQKIKVITKKAKKAKSFYDKSSHRRTITRSGGVYYYGGRTETYYSSRVLYHYKTPQWVCDNEGFWRTKEGYYVVACSDKSHGTVFRGSKGLCKVLDSGCAAGITDYYVNW